MRRSTMTGLARRTKPGSSMPVVIRDVPPGHNWGWYSQEDPRMHLQSVDQAHDYKLWLESKGCRVAEPVGTIPARVLKRIQKEITDKRQWIEDRWVRLMLDHGWLTLHLALPQVTLVAYPNTPNKFSRTLLICSRGFRKRNWPV